LRCLPDAHLHRPVVDIGVEDEIVDLKLVAFR
jgi:hypothetical protein